MTIDKLIEFPYRNYGYTESFKLVFYAVSTSVWILAVRLRIWRVTRFNPGGRVAIVGIGLLIASFLYKSLVLLVLSRGDFEVSFIPVADTSRYAYSLLYEIGFTIITSLSKTLVIVGCLLALRSKRGWCAVDRNSALKSVVEESGGGRADC